MDLESAAFELRRILLASTSFEMAAPRAVYVILQIIDCDGASLTIFEDSHVRYVGAAGSASILMGESRTVANSFTGDVVISQRTKRFDPKMARASSRGRAAVSEVRSGIVAPIILSGGVFGTVGIVSHTREKYSQEDADVLEQFAGIIAVELDAHRS